MIKQAQVLVVVAHPDDAELCAGGTVARWTREGKDVIYVVCCRGDKGTQDVNMKPDELARIREQEQLAAAKVAGVREVRFLRYPDLALEDTAEFRKEIVRLIRMYKPETVVTHDTYKRFRSAIDHRITGRVTLDAVWPSAGALLAYPDLLEQGLQPHRVKEMLLFGSEDPNYRSDITNTFDIKVAALGCHKSQQGLPTEEVMREECKMLAEGEDYELAEAFHRVNTSWTTLREWEEKTANSS